MTVAEVNAIAQAFSEGVANQDAAKLADLYEEDGKLLPPNFEPCEGKPAIQEWMEGMFQQGASELEIEPLDVQEAGELTIEYGRYTLTMRPPDGEAATDVGKYIVVHRSQDDGTTRIMLDIFNSNTPAEA
jgi:uncharacterized protein (TIGR02246 family)